MRDGPIFILMRGSIGGSTTAMLHEKLKNDWKQGDGIFAGRYALGRTATNMESREFSNSITIAFLNAALKEGARSGM
jgi:hypothetical protein